MAFKMNGWSAFTKEVDAETGEEREQGPTGKRTSSEGGVAPIVLTEEEKKQKEIEKELDKKRLEKNVITL